MLTGFMGNLGCELPPGSSQYGQLATAWFPLGFECRYDYLDQRHGPGAVTAVFQACLVLMPVALWWAAGRAEGVARRRRRREILVAGSAVAFASGIGFALAAIVANEAPPLLWQLALAAGLASLVGVAALNAMAKPRSTDCPCGLSV